jgi:hypothetical protein
MSERSGGFQENWIKSPQGNSANTTIGQFNKTRLFVIGLIAVLFLAAPFGYWFAARLALDCDPFTYAQIAKDMLAGGRLYTDVQTDKGPLTALAFAIPQVFFPRDYLAIGACLGLILIVQAAIFVWIFRDNPPAMVAAALCITILPLADWRWAWPSTEHLSNTFVVCNIALAYLIARRRWFRLRQAFLIGLFTCLCLNIRQTAVCSALVPVVSILTVAPNVKAMVKAFVAAVIGGLVGFGFIILLVWRIGDVYSYLQTLFFHPKTYASLGGWADVWKLISVNSNGVLAIAAVGCVSLGLFSQYRSLAITAIVAACMTIVIPRREFSHYFVGAFPYMALLLGVGLERYSNRKLFCWACPAIMACVLFLPIKETLALAYSQPREIEMADLAHSVDKLAPASSTMLVWGGSGSEPIVFASEHPTASKYWILWMMDIPNAPLLPITPKEIIASIWQTPRPSC